MITFHAATWADDLACDISQAQTSIKLSALSCQWPRGTSSTPLHRLWLALIGAAARGRQITMYLAAPNKTTPAAARNGITAEQNQRHNIHTTLVPLPRLLHAKTALIDNNIAWTGSGNFTSAAAHFNHEAFIRTDDAFIVADLAKFHCSIIGG